MRFYNVSVKQSVPTEANRSLTVRRWYYNRGRYCKTIEVEERAGCRLVLRQIATP
jgi:hypothetical protein